MDEEPPPFHGVQFQTVADADADADAEKVDERDMWQAPIRIVDGEEWVLRPPVE